MKVILMKVTLMCHEGCYSISWKWSWHVTKITIAENDPHMSLRLKLLSDPAESDPDKSDPDRVPDVSSLWPGPKG